MRIFDCTTFYDEGFMLDVRFNILNPYVDKFVVCESGYSHSGRKKNLILILTNMKNLKIKLSI